MPTGYTAELVDKGQDFRSFVLTCARAFGAAINQRDDPLNEPPKLQEPSDYHINALATAKAKVVALEAMSAEQRRAYGDNRRAEAIASARAAQERNALQNRRLDEMLEQVHGWTAPTSEHAGLKTFMVEQLTMSRNGDYSSRWLSEELAKTPMQCFDEELAAARHSVECQQSEHEKELARTAERNGWIRALWASLPE